MSSKRVWYGLWCVRMEKCRDGSYAVLEKFISVKVHPYMICFCTLWQSAFSVTCLGRFLFGGADNKCV